MDIHPTRTILWQRLVPDGHLHMPQYVDDAGLDLSVSEDTLLPGSHDPAGHRPIDIPCGIRVALPTGVAALVVARSSAVRRGLLVVSTIIDPGYRGDMFVLAYNYTQADITIRAGERVAQLLPVQVLAGRMLVEQVKELPNDSDRGRAGFGSTGGAGQ